MPLSPQALHETFACIQCGYCIDICPAVHQEGMGFERSNPRGKIRPLKNEFNKLPIISSFLQRKYINQDYFESLYHCTECGACDDVCYVNIPLSRLWEETKEWLMEEKGMEPLPAHATMYDNVKESHNLYGKPHSERKSWIPKDLKLTPQSPDYVLFAGCTSSYLKQEAAVAVLRILQKAGVTFDVLSDEWCNGSPMIRLGFGPLFREELLLHNMKEFERKHARNVLTMCASCYMTLGREYEKYGGRVTWKVVHISQVVRDLLKKKALKFPAAVKKIKVTYHDPAHLGRVMGEYDAPRDALKGIPGVELVEMEHSRASSFDCGATGGFREAFPDQATNVAAVILKEAIRTGAEVIVTGCTFCSLHLNAAAQALNLEVRTLGIEELVMWAMEPTAPLPTAAMAVAAK